VALIFSARVAFSTRCFGTFGLAQFATPIPMRYPWLAFSIAWVLAWIAIIVAARGAREHEPSRPERW
jgi:hypothetical protein